MYRRILIPLDRSDLGERVLPYAQQIGGRLGLELILMHVVSQEERERASTHKPYLDRVAGLLLNQAHYVQRSTGVLGGNANVRVQSMLAVGNPAEELLRYAEQNNVDLILMATHGRSGIGRWALGSVADKVSRRSKVPVWLVRAGTSEVIEHDTWSEMTMLVPLDGSTLAESVLPHVQALAQQRGVRSEVVLVGVVSAPPPANHLGSNTEHEQYLPLIEQYLSSAGLNVRQKILVGEPAEEIIEYASENPVSLIVMASHGRSGASRWAYGSVTDKVLRRAPCSLFLVRVSQPFW